MKRCSILTLFALLACNVYAQIAFTDVTSTAGIAFNSINVESLAWGDYDNDGDEDLFLSTNTISKLMRNDGGDVFTDVSITQGITVPFHSSGCVFGDLDNDGDLDIFAVSANGDSHDLLYKNLGQTENYAFQSVDGASSGITNTTNKRRGVSLLDYNRDGLLDIYVNRIGGDFLYKNLGNLQFQNVTDIAGIVVTDGEVGSVPTDINNDGWIDIFTGNRSAAVNKLFLNNGTGNFNDISVSAGITEVGLGMGVLSFDYDNDLDMDLYWTTWPNEVAPFQSNALYQNQGNLTFLNKATETNTRDTTGWGISCNAGDVDNDGFEDFFVSNGFSLTSTQSVLYRNDNGTTFQDITTATFGNLNWDARGVAFADYDNDGDLDVCLTGGPNADSKLWRNDSVNSNNWVTFKLIGANDSNLNAIGARIDITAGGITTAKEVGGGAGRGSFNSLPLEFGLGHANSIDIVKIRWPNGVTEVFNNVEINKINTIKQGSSTLSLNNEVFQSFKAFPNPFKDKFFLNLTGFTHVKSIKIYNVLGQEVFKANNIHSKVFEIVLRDNYLGILTILIETDTKIVKQKLLKI